MKKIVLSFLMAFVAAPVFAQKLTLNYEELKAYEGKYQYLNHSTLRMAASPKDTVLYAIVNQSMYALKPGEKDVFYNGAHQPIRFLRSSANELTGYIFAKDTLKLISKDVTFPKEMWYPRLVDDPKNFHYQYVEPTALNDGLPTGDYLKAGLDSSLLNTMMHKIVAGDYPNVHGVLIIKDGKLVFEEYFYGYTRDTLQEQRSATKSLISALTGIALHQGYIKSLDEKVVSYFPQYNLANNSELKQRITIKDMLSNQSGLSYDEAYDKAAGNENEMSYTDDWVKYTLDLPMIDTPGTKGRYASGNPITVGRIIELATNTPLHDFAAKNLYGPMGITNFKWNFKPDKSNSENYDEVFLRPRDMAKFGLLYLNHGVWNGKQLITAAWVDESTAKHSVVQGVDYGYLWWLKYLDAGGKRFKTFAAQGNGGQKIYVIKELNMVIVTTGGNFNSQSPSDKIIKQYILPAFSKN